MSRVAGHWWYVAKARRFRKKNKGGKVVHKVEGIDWSLATRRLPWPFYLWRSMDPISNTARVAVGPEEWGRPWTILRIVCGILSDWFYGLTSSVILGHFYFTRFYHRIWAINKIFWFVLLSLVTKLTLAKELCTVFKIDIFARNRIGHDNPVIARKLGISGPWEVKFM